MGDSVPKVALERAEEMARLSELSIVLGSSMTVSPFNTLPVHASKHIGYVLLTKQHTDFDEKACLTIHCDVDIFMKKLLQQLKLQNITEFHYQQTFQAYFLSKITELQVPFKCFETQNTLKGRELVMKKEQWNNLLQSKDTSPRLVIEFDEQFDVKPLIVGVQQIFNSSNDKTKHIFDLMLEKIVKYSL
ncbi:class IV sirtuin [Reticulomyxa filosa]|uniref:Class IV sirtuin n=1 Tax=Reticulomyxa filosa TaxID=46433 RepID=X6MHW9_RETFI|nr:class IV sirtuin [Reticulomyxa filosa]|eukprot:ETO13022.1 class IV sirtuin [Reticulomyxa filosa]